MTTASLLLAQIVFAASGVLTADFGKEVSPIRPELHSSGFGPTICSQTEQDLADVKAMGFAYARTHDWALINPNQRCCDWHHMFPLTHLDAKDPKNYVFGPTDYLLKRTREETGLKVFYRLGTSIEHSGKKIHFNSLIPDDFDKVAEVFAATVRHYNRGWADGHNWDIKYWEIWNEPDGNNNMWCLPEGDDDPWEPNTPEEKAKCERRVSAFVTFFAKCVKRLKDEFGDSIKVGGPAMCTWSRNPKHDTVKYFQRIIRACQDLGVAPDFLSWHGYVNNPMTLVDNAEDARRVCEEMGLKNCELIVNEWHYFGREYTWQDMQRSSDPAAKARVYEGPNSHFGTKASAFTLTQLIKFQLSKLDQAYFYGCRHTGSWGFKDEMQNKFKLFYALKLFGDIVRDYQTICEFSSAGTVTTMAVKNAAGRKGLLVADYGGKDQTITIDVKGVAADAKVNCVVLDHTHDLTPFEATFAEGKLILTKPDTNSASFFVTFD